MEFTFSKRARTLSVGLMLTGLLVLAMGYIMTKGDPNEAPMLGQRMWSDLLVNGFFFLFRIDWIDYLPTWFRGSVLALLGLVLVSMVVTVVLYSYQ